MKTETVNKKRCEDAKAERREAKARRRAMGMEELVRQRVARAPLPGEPLEDFEQEEWK
jgi:hypothetical protein